MGSLGYEKVGSCSHCGACCYKMGQPHMLDFRRECKYIFKKDGLVFCEIQQAIEEKDHTFIAMIPIIDFDYWKSECENYPNPDDPAMLPPRHKLPSECTFELKLKVDVS